MAEQEPTAEQLAQIAAENEEDEHSVNYKPPAQKSIQEIQELDKDDESLRKYKEALLGRVTVSADPNVPNVTVTRLTLVCSSAPGPLELDLTGDLESFKKQSFVLKEGVEYRIKISFRVNREIVSGMKYIQHTYRKGVKIDKTDYMVGSYGPRAEEYEFLTPMEEAPKGSLTLSCLSPGFRRKWSILWGLLGCFHPLEPCLLLPRWSGAQDLMGARPSLWPVHPSLSVPSNHDALTCGTCCGGLTNL
ncbi:rho GDP-dissociation inhibitor 1 isoform X2 [Carlito syrichta]|uniref:Rho GDP-dissociation inhibitor 1 n=1 Tax=Carlito syrichta TaxID=1868482 RepID=A0A3Q0DYQ2_CARSF|nr:rho GDP-dissociation inhibitor 1 isoform X2 [Carlito syrichta]